MRSTVRPLPDPTCLICSKPIASGTLVLLEHGDLFHVRCRSRRLVAQALGTQDGAREARDRAADQLVRADALLGELWRRRMVRLAGLRGSSIPDGLRLAAGLEDARPHRPGTGRPQVAPARGKADLA